MAFVMSGNDILRDYRAAKDRRAQVQILADLNCCTRGEIAEFLLKCGEEVDKRLLPKPRKREGGAAADTHTHTHRAGGAGGCPGGWRGYESRTGSRYGRGAGAGDHCAAGLVRGGRRASDGHDRRDAAGSFGRRDEGGGRLLRQRSHPRPDDDGAFQRGRRAGELRRDIGGVTWRS